MSREPRVTSTLRRRIWAVTAASLISAPVVVQAPAFHFRDVTVPAGIDWVHVTGGSGRKYLVETMGSGAVFFDYDSDLDPDIYLANGGALPGFTPSAPVEGALYRNEGNGRFSEVTIASSLHQHGYGMGAVAADYDNDGDADLYLTHHGPDQLFRNNGDGTFTDVTALAGVENPLWSSSAAWSDLDGDGFLDLYVATYLNWSLKNHPDCSQGMGSKVLHSYCLPDAFQGLSDTLHRNRGDGTFEDQSREAGIALPGGKGLGVVAVDYDQDGRPDLYVANDTVPNFLFHNKGGMRFSEVGLDLGVAYDGKGNALAGMGVDAGDYDQDGDFDLFVTNFQGEPNTLYRQDGDGFFTDVSFPSGLGRPSLAFLGFGAAFADLDNDSDLDVVVANGHLDDTRTFLDEAPSYPQLNQVYRNRGDGRFDVVSGAGGGFDLLKVSRGLTLADIEGDGDLDLLFTNSADRPDLLRNDTVGGNALRVLLVGRGANRDAVGSRLIFDSGRGSETIVEVRAGSSYLSQNDRIVHLGLGSRGSAPRVRITWPGSGAEEVGPLPAGTLAVIVEGKGVVSSFPFR